MFDWIWTLLPWWVWAIAAGLALGLGWRLFGWQGMLGAAIAVLTLGAYRRGRQDGTVLGKRHDVNRDDIVVGVETAPPKKRRSVVDWFRP